MTKAITVTIDGQHYDSVTGLPVSAESVEKPQGSSIKVGVKRPSAAIKVHKGPQRSVTLHRKALKKPTPAKHTIVTRTQRKHMDIARPQHASISRFAPHPVGVMQPAKQAKKLDIAPAVAHPHVAKAHTRSTIKSSQPLTQSITASAIKDHAVNKAVQSARKQSPLKKRFFFRPRQRIATILSATFAVVLLGGYVTYLNMPVLSVRVAAAQAGIDANYPNYRPDGYALSGPVTYSDGKVAINFKANGGNQAFTVAQSKSGWDSEALLDNYVSPKAGSDYVPYTERGLTIYTYGTNAAWVNGGILYTVEGDAPLSNSQIRRIATSLL